MTKQQILDAVQNLPDEFSIDELMERLLIIDVIEKGMQEVKEGKVVSSQKARKRFEKWLK